MLNFCFYWIKLHDKVTEVSRVHETDQHLITFIIKRVGKENQKFNLAKTNFRTLGNL